METSASHRHSDSGSRGFTMIEVIVAMLVFAVGLVSLGSLVSKTVSGTESSRFASLASNLASEKLEDLNRWPTWDPNVYAPSGSSEGSLTADTSASITSNGITETVNYYDDVEIADGSGAVSETVSVTASTLCPSGGAGFITTTHSPNGETTQTCASAASTADRNVVSFHRRWTIEKDQPITGVRRVTVYVKLSNGYIEPPVSYQQSMVRP